MRKNVMIFAYHDGDFVMPFTMYSNAMIRGLCVDLQLEELIAHCT